MIAKESDGFLKREKALTEVHKIAAISIVLGAVLIFCGFGQTGGHSPAPVVVQLAIAGNVPASCASADPQALLIEQPPVTLYLCQSGVYKPVLSQTRWSDAEPIAGVRNGVNRTFTINFVPTTPVSLVLTFNGLVLREGIDYALAGRTITFSAYTTAPQNIDIIQAWYRY